jgi:hypothetical protein
MLSRRQSGVVRHLPYAKVGSNTSRRVLEKLVDTGEKRSVQKSAKTMLRTMTEGANTIPSRIVSPLGWLYWNMALIGKALAY